MKNQSFPWLENVYNLKDTPRKPSPLIGHAPSDDAVDVLLRHIDDLYEEENFDAVKEVMKKIDISKLDQYGHVALLTATKFPPVYAPQDFQNARIPMMEKIKLISSEEFKIRYRDIF